MGNTRDGILGRDYFHLAITPSRSKGALGIKDAADPRTSMCYAGDTQGPVGYGADLSELLNTPPALAAEQEILVMSVDMDKIRKLIYATTLSEEANKATKVGFFSGEISQSNMAEIKKDAAIQADKLMEELTSAMESGPQSLQAFQDKMEKRKENARKALQEKFTDATETANNWQTGLGVTIKALALLKFGSTVTIKTLSSFTGLGGTAIDLAYSGAIAGIEQAQKPQPDKTVKGVVTEETGENVVQELAQTINEMIADGTMSKKEKNLLTGWLGNYEGNKKKITAQLKKIEERLYKEAFHSPGSKKAKRYAAERLKQIEKLTKLRKKTVTGIVGKNASGLAKKATGKVVSVVFLASEVSEAWDDLQKDWKSSN